MSRRIGVMGGMFDPIHRGHTEAALAAAQAMALDEVRMIPCATPNHRGAAIASPADRLAMLSLAVRDLPGFHVDEREIQRQGISYTVDTLRSLQQDFPGAILVLILGEDSFRSLPGWERWQQIFELAHICVVNRPAGNSPDDGMNGQMHPRGLPSALAAELVRRRSPDVQTLFRRKSGGIYLLNKDALDVSSSQLRQVLQQAGTEATGGWLDESVSGYIRDTGLYLSHC